MGYSGPIVTPERTRPRRRCEPASPTSLIATEHATTMARSDGRNCTMFIRALRSAVIIAGIGVASAHAQAPPADSAPFAPFVPPWPTDHNPMTIIPPPGYGYGAFEAG